MNLSKFLHHPTGKLMMSIILGLGLATLFRSACYGKNCKIVHAPPMEDIEDKIYKFEGKCYRMSKNHIKCKQDSQTIYLS